MTDDVTMWRRLSLAARIHKMVPDYELNIAPAHSWCPNCRVISTGPIVLSTMLISGHFVYAPSQSETTLHCNVASHWLGAHRVISVVVKIFHPKLRVSLKSRYFAWWDYRYCAVVCQKFRIFYRPDFLTRVMKMAPFHIFDHLRKRCNFNLKRWKLTIK